MSTYMGLPTNQHDALENIQLLVGAGALLYSSNNPELIELASSILDVTQKYSLNAARSRKQNLAINSQNRIITQREACGLTTAELARLLDLDEEIIIQWESGEYEPTISMLIPLANVLGCDPLSLLSENNTAVPVRVNVPEVNAESIGARIESVRKKLGLTESDLARMIHTYSDPINDWECGICEVPADQIVPLASALHCDPMWLLTGKPTDGGTCA
ncbi:TPA: helix-turn-helix domain-containing protein [Escherichia coli]|uniref:helix-turn-helix domain-containing protein n=1 Tax=Escherichia coli TaxID=562 RepID=UPI000BE358A2|nr:helix-turn-helix domain-containing protein [Escherichia coli]EFN8407978.1 helix-turn-helix domain-containing protein [Escherichia coli O15]EEU9456722.1 helix-turn-helix domain-containing protein [Escherichia coli]EEV5553709.1 helix-turn-helix domain-containing protein [Escherichia coli]EEW2339413.1 helix-turn-helix domain-containing protein [Escherichia coli]EFL4153169.1 helix-turn-helix domain-containing protein [Escherichia coli]